MSRLKLSLLFLALVGFGLVYWTTNNAPALNAPLGPELLAIAIGLALAAFGWRHRNGTSDSDLLSGALLGLTLLSGITLTRAISGFVAIEQEHPLCTAMPGVVQQIECIFQAATNQNLALRTASYFIAALVLFCGSYFASRRAPRLLAAALFSVVTLFALATLAMHYTQWHLSPALESLVAGDYRESRMSYLMGNPTWITPYLAPSLIIGAAYLISPAIRLLPKLLVTLAIGATLYLQLRTQQRGSLLVVGLYVGTLGLAGLLTFIRRIRQQPLNFFPGLGLTFGWIAAYGGVLYLSYEPVSRLLAELGFGDRLAGTSWSSAERSAIWQGAWSGMPGHWWWGHGYGSWYREGAPLAAKFGFYDILDTAHNFFVQLGFELGLVQLAALLLCIGLLAVYAIRAANERAQAAMIVGICVAVYLPILAVQEIDFVRSVYMINAMTWGWVVAGGFTFTPNRRVDVLRNRTVIAFGTLAAIFAISALLATRFFSLAGYQYEANLRTNYTPSVRWLRPEGTLTFVDRRAAKDGLYAVYPLLQLNSAKYTHSIAGAPKAEDVTRATKGQSYVPVAARFISRGPDVFASSGYTLDNERLISAMLEWPPKLSRLPLRWSDGLYGWEQIPSLFGDAHVQWCGKTCALRFAACPSEQQVVQLKLGAMRQDLSAADPLVVTVVPGATGDLTPPLTLTFSEPDQIAAVEVPAGVDLNLTVNRTFKPAQDNRDLGIMLISGMCR